MANSLRSKLVLSYLAIATFTALLIFLLIRSTSDQRLKTLVREQELSELQDEIVRWYEAEGSWDGFRQYFLALHPPPSIRDEGAQRNNGNTKGVHGVIDADRQLLNRYLNFDSGDTLSEALLNDALPIVVAGETVGWIVPDDSTGISLQAEQQIFLQNTNRALLFASALAVVAAIVLGFGLASVLLRPINALTQASELMAQGELEQEIDVDAPGELGQLAKSFTHMSHEVALANRRRRQLTADIAHDLSTPLHIASGYLEMMLEDNHMATPERLAIVASNLDHLRRLIEDLDLLALTDNNKLSLNREPLALDVIMPQVVTSFQSLAVIQKTDLQLEPLPDKLPLIVADRGRLIQVLGNILNNALRFTPSGGTIAVSVLQDDKAVHIKVRDSGAGIAPEDLPFVFDRFYQGDRARGQSGKMGLGLAISNGLIKAMGGEISAESAGHNQGATFTISLCL